MIVYDGLNKKQKEEVREIAWSVSREAFEEFEKGFVERLNKLKKKGLV